MDELVVEVLRYFLNNAPEVAILAIIALRLEQKIGACMDYQEKLIDKLTNGK